MMRNLYELARQRAADAPLAVAITGANGVGWKTITSRDLLALVDRLADELAALGVRTGDRVVLWLPNHWRTPVYLFGLWKLGAIVVPFDRSMNPDAATAIIAAVEPRRVLIDTATAPAWAAAAPVVTWWEPGSRPPSPGAVSAWRPPAEDLALIAFTSGTTGAPKGCMITHQNLLFEVSALEETIPLDSSCRLASILPLSHLFELTCGLLYPLAHGASVHYVPSQRGPEIVRVLAERHITHMIVVPQLLVAMGRALDDRLRAGLPGPLYRWWRALADRLPLTGRRWLVWPLHHRLGGCLRLIAAGGAALPPDTHRLWERFGVRVVQGYGASECSPVVAAGRPDGSTPIGSVGRPLTGVEARLGADGEVLTRGPNVMRGYWRDPARTAAVLVDGWYHTGDLATIDGAGNLRLIGRASDLIVLPSGLNVWPQDVEEVLQADPAVAEAAVRAVPSVDGGAVLHAYLLPPPGGEPSPDPMTIAARRAPHLAQHQRPVSASWWPEPAFPRTAIGKLRRSLLPLPVSTAAAPAAIVGESADPVAEAIASVVHASNLASHQTLGALGLDSLGLTEVALALEERTGKRVADDDLHPDLTLAQVRALVAQAPAVNDGATARRRGREAASLDQPLWPYTWGRLFRFLAWPVALLYRYAVTRTIVLGADQLVALPERVILAGTHHGFPDLPLVRVGLRRTAARRLANRLVVAVHASGFSPHWLVARYTMLALGFYPLRQFSQQRASLRQLARVAEAGNTVLIFPQGNHTNPALERAGDRQARFHRGVAYLAEALGAAVVPFGLAGSELLMPPDLQRFDGPVVAGTPLALRRGPLAIAFGAPLRPAPGETAVDFTARLQEQCFALTRQAEAALAAVEQSGSPTPATPPWRSGS